MSFLYVAQSIQLNLLILMVGRSLLPSHSCDLLNNESKWQHFVWCFKTVLSLFIKLIVQLRNIANTVTFTNNALLGGWVRVRVWIREQRKIKRRSKALLAYVANPGHLSLVLFIRSLLPSHSCDLLNNMTSDNTSCDICSKTLFFL